LFVSAGDAKPFVKLVCGEKTLVDGKVGNCGLLLNWLKLFKLFVKGFELAINGFAVSVLWFKLLLPKIVDLLPNVGFIENVLLSVGGALNKVDKLDCSFALFVSLLKINWVAGLLVKFVASVADLPNVNVGGTAAIWSADLVVLVIFVNWKALFSELSFVLFKSKAPLEKVAFDEKLVLLLIDSKLKPPVDENMDGLFSAGGTLNKLVDDKLASFSLLLFSLLLNKFVDKFDCSFVLLNSLPKIDWVVDLFVKLVGSAVDLPNVNDGADVTTTEVWSLCDLVVLGKFPNENGLFVVGLFALFKSETALEKVELDEKLFLLLIESKLKPPVDENDILLSVGAVNELKLADKFDVTFLSSFFSAALVFNFGFGVSQHGHFSSSGLLLT